MDQFTTRTRHRLGVHRQLNHHPDRLHHNIRAQSPGPHIHAMEFAATEVEDACHALATSRPALLSRHLLQGHQTHQTSTHRRRCCMATCVPPSTLRLQHQVLGPLVWTTDNGHCLRVCQHRTNPLAAITAASASPSHSI
eukprot:3522121-Amphidinium_carterae.1